jgi:magnesium-transporting ATPase (P-type)
MAGSRQGRVQGSAEILADPALLHRSQIGVGDDHETRWHGQPRPGELAEIRPLTTGHRGVVSADSIEIDHVAGHVISLRSCVPTIAPTRVRAQSPKTCRAPPKSCLGQVAAALGVDVTTGLTASEAADRLSTAGPNDLPQEPPRSLLRSVFAQLRETMIVVLLVAAVLTAATGDLADCVVILLVIIVNTTVGVVQERRAVGAVAALRTLSTPQSTVRRDGAAYRIPTTELVAGDVLQVAGGDIVGADARLLTGHELQVDEALLTGESKPVERDPDGDCPAAAPAADRTTMVHAGTLVVHGSGTAVVVATGVATELGHIATLLHEHSAPDTPLQCRLAALGRRLSAAAAADCVAVVLLGLLRGQPWELRWWRGSASPSLRSPSRYRLSSRSPWLGAPSGWPRAARSFDPFPQWKHSARSPCSPLTRPGP